MWITHWRRSHWCLKSPVTQLDCLFNRLLRQTSTPAFLVLCEGNPSVTDGFPSQKASNAASVGPMLVQRWHTTIGVTLCQRWPNVSVPTLAQRWRATVGPIDKSTLAQRWWADVGPTLVSRRWPNVRVDVGPTLGQRRNASWDRLYIYYGRIPLPAGQGQQWKTGDQNRIWWLYKSTLVELYKQLVLLIDH